MEVGESLALFCGTAQVAPSAESVQTSDIRWPFIHAELRRPLSVEGFEKRPGSWLRTLSSSSFGRP